MGLQPPFGSGEMAQQLEVLAALTGILSSILSTRVNSLQLPAPVPENLTLFGALQLPTLRYTYAHSHTHTNTHN